jgi:hypothetical protein
MEDNVRQDILAVLRETLKILTEPEPNPSLLKDISNHVIHNASIYQDEDSISIAVLIYSLSKFIDRLNSGFDYSKIKNLVHNSIEYLEDENVESYQDFISQIFRIISKQDTKFNFYVQEVINQASIKKGSKIYEHGISASKTAQILGLSLWDFYRYLGATNVSDMNNDISNVRERLKYTRKLFA